MADTKPKSYIALLKSNPAFRNLWYGQVVSELGDWLNSIAIYMLVIKLGGGGMAMGLTMMAKVLPVFFVSPLAGVLIDRMDRKTILIVSDLLRFIVVLGFLWIDQEGELWLLYTLVVVEIALAGFFEPARSALIPALTEKSDLVTANALSGSTWSVMVAFGAALGGVVVGVFGIRTAFIVDACTFLVSAYFIYKIQCPQMAPPPKPVPGQTWWGDLAEVTRYLKQEPGVMVLAMLKSGLAVSGGVMTLIPLLANKMYAAAGTVSLAIGTMYFSRGIGAALGPPLVRRLFGDESQVLRLAIVPAFFVGGFGYYLFSTSQTLMLASFSIGMATLCGSIVWVFSSALIHLEAEDRFLGRIFSLEMALLTLVIGISNFIVGWSVENMGLSPQQAARGIALAFIVPGMGWSGFLVFRHRKLKRGECVGSVCPVEPSDAQLPPTSL